MNLNTSWISQAVLQWVSGESGLFVATATNWLRYIAIIMLVLLAAGWLLDTAAGANAGNTFRGFISFMGRLVLATVMLRCYSTPLPWGGVSFSGLIPRTAMALAAQVDTSANQQVMQDLTRIEQGLKPGSVLSIWKVGQEFVDVVICEVVLLLMRGVLFLLSTVGFVGIGIGIALGPLSIPWLLVPRLSFLFWNWLSFLLAMSMYTVVGSVLIALWSNILLVVFNNLFAGNYSIVDAAALVGPFVAINCALLFSCLGLGGFTASLYGGAAAQLDGFGKSAMALAAGKGL